MAKTLKNYFYVQHNMPVLTKFDARPVILPLLQEKNQRDVVPVKAKEQKWFKSVFAKAKVQLTKKSLGHKISFKVKIMLFCTTLVSNFNHFSIN